MCADVVAVKSLRTAPLVVVRAPCLRDGALEMRPDDAFGCTEVVVIVGFISDDTDRIACGALCRLSSEGGPAFAVLVLVVDTEVILVVCNRDN